MANEIKLLCPVNIPQVATQTCTPTRRIRLQQDIPIHW